MQNYRLTHIEQTKGNGDSVDLSYDDEVPNEDRHWRVEKQFNEVA